MCRRIGKTQQNALSGELALEEAVDLSQDGLRNDDGDDDDDNDDNSNNNNSF
jgi:hypothetical protein